MRKINKSKDMKILDVIRIFEVKKHDLKQKLLDETGNKDMTDYDVELFLDQISEKEGCHDNIYTFLAELTKFTVDGVYVGRERKTEDYYMDSPIEGCSGYFKLK